MSDESDQQDPSGSGSVEASDAAQSRSRDPGFPDSQPVDDWHARDPDSVLEDLDSRETGLSSAVAERRLESIGPNRIQDDEAASPVAIFVSQFQDFLIYLLVAAAVLSLGVGLLPGAEPRVVDATLIFAILVANGVFGFVQDYRAERSMAALRELSTPEATVVREGEKRVVEATDVVPGDVVAIEQGDAVPADARLLSATDLETDESALTGESAAVQKTVAAASPDAPLAERDSMVYMNTTAVRGRGRAVVVSTGMDTEVGAIATQLRTAEEEQTPFQEEVDDLGRSIGVGVVALIGLIALTQFTVTSAAPVTILLTGVTLAVAAVPEGLPAVVTLTLAMGSRRMLARNALVRRLAVVESLGAVDTIVTDKTGTLTENAMTVTRLAVGDEVIELSATDEADGDRDAYGARESGDPDDCDRRGDPQTTRALFTGDGEAVPAATVVPILRCGAQCNNAERAPADADEEYLGDPIEVALLVAAARAGIDAGGERLAEVPFSSERKRMTTVVRDSEPVLGDRDGPTAYVKGAPDVILDRCDRVLRDGEVVPLTAERREAVRERTRSFGADALRVLGFAAKGPADPDAAPETLESGLVFLGLQGMIDPPRSEVPGAVAACREAGIRVLMATGDNRETATAVGEQVGFDTAGAMTGREIDSLQPGELRERVEETEIFARVSPSHKVEILEALHDNGDEVAMTGDGVNDAPALRNADVGIAMGQRGTDVAQQASDMVLQDDNFVSIRDAIAEGRGIFDNIRKFVNYQLSAHAGEVLVVFLGVLLGTALFPAIFAAGAGTGGATARDAGAAEAIVLTPVMLLWINMVTDGLPALALGLDPKAAGIMDRPPRGREESVINRRMLVSIASIGVVMTGTGLALFFVALDRTGDLRRAQTLLFTFLVTVEMVRIQVIRRRYRQRLRSNPWLLVAIGASLTLQLAVVYTPVADLFGVVPISATGWAWIGAAFLAFLVLSLVLEGAWDRLLERE